MSAQKPSLMTEKEMREATVPYLKDVAELQRYISDLVTREHNYGTAAYAASLAATAAFNHVATTLGLTGFQASCADLDFLRRTRCIEGPFMIMKGRDALFPQYDLPARLTEFLNDIQPWLREQAAAELAKNEGHAVSSVVAHWQALARKEGQS